MPRSLYSPRLSDDVVRSLYREGQRQRMPMTRLADLLLRQSLDRLTTEPPAFQIVREDAADPPAINSGAA